MIKQWKCSACGVDGLVRPQWGPHTSDVIGDIHNDQSFNCNAAYGLHYVRISAIQDHATAEA